MQRIEHYHMKKGLRLESQECDPSGYVAVAKGAHHSREIYGAAR